MPDAGGLANGESAPKCPRKKRCTDVKAKNPSEEGSKRARGGTRTGFRPLSFRHSPASLRNSAESGNSTTRSEAQGVHIVHTPAFAQFGVPNQAAPAPVTSRN